MATAFEEVDVQVGKEILTLRVPAGTSDADITAFVQQQSQPSSAAAPAPDGHGPLGIISPQFRQRVQQAQQAPADPLAFPAPLPPKVRTMMEQAALPTAGAMTGAVLGAPLGPAGIAVGGALGGLLGEVTSQELGVSPESRTAMVLSGAAPLVGPVIGKAGKLLGKAGSFLARKSPPFRAAEAQAELEGLIAESGSLGTRVLSKQQGLLSRRAAVLFRAARQAKAQITAADLPRTQHALGELAAQAQGFRSLPEGRYLLRAIKQIQDDLFQADRPITTNDFGQIRQLVGAATGRLETQAGVKLGGTKHLYGAMSDDLDRLAKGGGVTGKAAAWRQAAGQRAKLEFAVRDLEGVVSKATTTMRGEGDTVILNAKQVLDRLHLLTNPKSPGYDKNFASALQNELPEIRKFFEKVNSFTSPGSPAGPGSIVYRGATAKAGREIAQRLIGVATGEMIAGTAGAMIGATAPEMITSLLLTQKGRQLMLAMARSGRGTVNATQWAILAEVVVQAAMVRPPPPQFSSPIAQHSAAGRAELEQLQSTVNSRRLP